MNEVRHAHTLRRVLAGDWDLLERRSKTPGSHAAAISVGPWIPRPTDVQVDDGLARARKPRPYGEDDTIRSLPA